MRWWPPADYFRLELRQLERHSCQQSRVKRLVLADCRAHRPGKSATRQEVPNIAVHCREELRNLASSFHIRVNDEWNETYIFSYIAVAVCDLHKESTCMLECFEYFVVFVHDAGAQWNLASRSMDQGLLRSGNRFVWHNFSLVLFLYTVNVFSFYSVAYTAQIWVVVLLGLSVMLIVSWSVLIREILQCTLSVRCGRFTLEGGVTVRQVHVASDTLRPDWFVISGCCFSQILTIALANSGHESWTVSRLHCINPSIAQFFCL